MTSGHIYYVESNASWFVIRCPNIRVARRYGRAEGYQDPKARRATKAEVKSWLAWKGYPASHQLPLEQDPS